MSGKEKVTCPSLSFATGTLRIPAVSCAVRRAWVREGTGKKQRAQEPFRAKMDRTSELNMKKKERERERGLPACLLDFSFLFEAKCAYFYLPSISFFFLN